MDEAWIGFAGAVIGGLLTLVGVFVTIKYYKKQEKCQHQQEIETQGQAIYWFFKAKLDLLDDWSKMFEHAKKIKMNVVPSGELVSNGDTVFLFERLRYMTEWLEDSEISHLIDLLAMLKNLQEGRDAVDGCTDLKQKDQAYKGMFIPTFKKVREAYNNEIIITLNKLHKK
jgi:hypothetical protein